jgi:ssDNA-binding Zn-finger/Zn-ribbon topoisomerase 1
MARTSIRERPDREEVLWPVQKMCPACGHPMRLRYSIPHVSWDNRSYIGGGGI